DNDLHARRSKQRWRRARCRYGNDGDRPRPEFGFSTADHCRNGVRPDEDVGGAGHAVRVDDDRRPERRGDRPGDDTATTVIDQDRSLASPQVDDILWQNTDGQAEIWEMNGTKVIGMAPAGPNPGPSWKAIGTGDFNADGHSDILWRNADGQAATWEMNGTT